MGVHLKAIALNDMHQVNSPGTGTDTSTLPKLHRPKFDGGDVLMLEHVRMDGDEHGGSMKIYNKWHGGSMKKQQQVAWWLNE